LRLMVVWGLVGVIVTAAILVTVYRVVRSRTDRPHRMALTVLFGTLVIFGLTQKPLAYPYFLWLFFFGQMVILALAPAEQDDATEASPVTESTAA
jgi:hypothetical protein